jgi:transcriptional regulator with XRE-family HTH domain
MSVTVTRMDAYDAVETALDDARQELGVKWVELARMADISVQTLLRYRKGEQRTPDTTRAIERALHWERGSIDNIRAGGRPTNPDDDDLTVEELEAALAHLRPIVERLERAAAQKRRNKPTGT